MTLDVDTLPSALLLELIAMVTLALGCVVNVTWNVAEPPLSLVNSPSLGETLTLGKSSEIPWTAEMPSDAIVTSPEPSRLARCKVFRARSEKYNFPACESMANE